MNKIWNRPEWLTRQTLINRLEAGLSKKLTLISAPAGFGKSTLARQWLSHHQAKVVWISLSADDNQLDQFISHISRRIKSTLQSSLKLKKNSYLKKSTCSHAVATSSSRKKLLAIPR